MGAKGGLLPPVAGPGQARVQTRARGSTLVAVQLLRQAASTREPPIDGQQIPGLALTRRAWLALVIIGASSCLSPTLPLPPPNKPDIEGPDASGNVTLSGSVLPGASAHANNLVTGASAGQKSDPRTGQYRFRIAASFGDRIEFFYVYDEVSSDRTYFFIGNPAAAASTVPWPDSGVHFGEVDASVDPPR